MASRRLCAGSTRRAGPLHVESIGQRRAATGGGRRQGMARRRRSCNAQLRRRARGVDMRPRTRVSPYVASLRGRLGVCLGQVVLRLQCWGALQCGLRRRRSTMPHEAAKAGQAGRRAGGQAGRQGPPMRRRHKRIRKRGPLTKRRCSSTHAPAIIEGTHHRPLDARVFALLPANATHAPATARTAAWRATPWHRFAHAASSEADELHAAPRAGRKQSTWPQCHSAAASERRLPDHVIHRHRLSDRRAARAAEECPRRKSLQSRGHGRYCAGRLRGRGQWSRNRPLRLCLRRGSRKAVL